MTTPSDLPAGYPDWGRIDLITSNAYQSWKTGDTFAAGGTSGTLYVGAYPNLIVELFCAGHGARISLIFFLDSAATIQVGQHTLDVIAGDSMQAVVPTLGAFMQIVTQATAGPSITDVVASVAGYNNANRPSVALTRAALLSPSLIAVGAGATVNTDVTSTVPGLALFRYATSAVAFQITVSALDYTGASTVIWSIQSSLAQPAFGDFELMLPAEHIRVACTNNDAAGKSFRIALETV